MRDPLCDKEYKLGTNELMKCQGVPCDGLPPHHPVGSGSISCEAPPPPHSVGSGRVAARLKANVTFSITPRSDQNVISVHNINSLSGKEH